MSFVLAWLQTHLSIWVLIGLFGQSLFMMRFVVQWIASGTRQAKHRAADLLVFQPRRRIDPLFVYALHQQDIVFTLGQGLGLFIYLRNLYFIHGKKKRDANV